MRWSGKIHSRWNLWYTQNFLFLGYVFEAVYATTLTWRERNNNYDYEITACHDPWTSTFTFLNHTDHKVDRYKFAKHMELNIYMGLNGPQVWWFLWQARFKTLGFFGKYKRCGFSDRSFLFRCRTSFASPPQVKSLNTLFFVSVCTVRVLVNTRALSVTISTRCFVLISIKVTSFLIKSSGLVP